MNESIRRAADILRALRESGDDRSARELAEVVDLPKSTTQRMLRTLESRGLVRQHPVSRKYGLGPETLTLGMAYLRRVDIRTQALPHMVGLRDQLGETVGLTVRVGAHRIYVEQVEATVELRAKNEIGVPYPLWSGSPGRVLLAEATSEELPALLADADDDAFARADPPTADGLRALLERVREVGYSEAFEETIPGVNTIAAPIKDGSEVAVAVLSVSGPASRFDAAAMAAGREPLLDAAATVSYQLGNPA